MSSRLGIGFLVALAIGQALPSTSSAVEQPHAVDTVLSLFAEADLVLLGERHWSQQDAGFRLALLRHPDFAATVDDIVVEFATSRYQDRLDRWLLELEELPKDEIVDIWRETTTTTGAWDSLIYEEFLREIRRLNTGLPRDGRVRVVAGDPPIRWEEVEVYADRLPYMNRGWAAVRTIEREVLDRERKGLVIYGYSHFLRVDDEMDEDWNQLRRLEALRPDGDFRVVLPLTMADSSPVDLTESLSDELQAAHWPVYLSATDPLVANYPAAEYLYGGTMTLADTCDGLLWFGPDPDTRVSPPEDFYEDHPSYAAELERRRGLRRRITDFRAYY